MINKKAYSNGQKAQELNRNKLTFFFKNGNVKAEGLLINKKMEGEWKFYRETGQLWQVGNFKNDMKNGTWLRYDKNNKLDYKEIFSDNKIVKNK
jgi:antitoxin component YwqK of YwqJK toxin-antitoxin module